MNKYRKGTAYYFASLPGIAYGLEGAPRLYGIVKELLASPVLAKQGVTIQAPGCVQFEVCEQPSYNRTVVHIINFPGEIRRMGTLGQDFRFHPGIPVEVLPIHDVRLTFRSRRGMKLAGVFEEPSHHPLVMSKTEVGINVTIGRLTDYMMIVAEWQEAAGEE